MNGGYKFGRFGGGGELGPEADWLLAGAAFLLITGLIVHFLVRTGRVKPWNSEAAWAKVAAVGVFVVILLLILADEFLI